MSGLGCRVLGFRVQGLGIGVSGSWLIISLPGRPGPKNLRSQTSVLPDFGASSTKRGPLEFRTHLEKNIAGIPSMIYMVL